MTKQPHNRATKQRRRVRAAGVAAVLLVVLMSQTAVADSIRLHRSASVSGDEIRLADIAELNGERAEALGELVVASFGSRSELTLRHADVRKALDGADVHWGLVSLRGYTTCRVRQTATEARADDREPRQASEVVSNVEQVIDLDTAMTLRAEIVELLERMTGASREELRISFSDRDGERLDRSAVSYRFELEPGASSGVGRVPVVVRQYRGEAVVDEFSITVDVERRVLALVAGRSISRGEAFTSDAVRVREVYLGVDRGQPLDDAGLVVGQHAAAVLREGAVIYPDHVRSPVLVRRGELVTVRAMVGDLVVRTVGRAVEQGVADEVIQVRNEGSRDSFFATVTGRREVVVESGEMARE